MIRQYLLIVAVALALAAISEPRASAQTGMTKATMKLLAADLLEAGFFPTIGEESGKYFVIVRTDAGAAATAAQVNSFAAARSVTAKVLAARFE